MIMDPWKTGCQVQLRYLTVIFVCLGITIFGVIVVSAFIPLTGTRLVQYGVGGFGLLVLLMLAGAILWSVYESNQRSARLDAAFTPLGLTGKALMFVGRQYHGILEGRQVDVYFYRGPSLDIYIASPLNVRLGIGIKGQYSHTQSGVPNFPELIIDEPELANLGIYPLDHRWATDLLENFSARADIISLTTKESKSESRTLIFQPEALQLQLYRIDISILTFEKLRLLVSSCIHLVGVAESLPPPAVPVTASALERQIRVNRGAFTLRIQLVTCGVIAFFTGIIIVFVLILIR
jgi:hypothetical protein